MIHFSSLRKGIDRRIFLFIPKKYNGCKHTIYIFTLLSKKKKRHLIAVIKVTDKEANVFCSIIFYGQLILKLFPKIGFPI